MLLPFIRINRACATILIYPQHPIQAIAISETISIIIPLFNPNLYKKTIGIILAIMYMPNYASAIINIENKNRKIYYEFEIYSILIFILFLIINK